MNADDFREASVPVIAASQADAYRNMDFVRRAFRSLPPVKPMHTETTLKTYLKIICVHLRSSAVPKPFALS
ncbi:MAG: hypothetical protein IPJ28_05490 [Betaproteobacteria bacterium]|nr:hypothetical protein [Betaproteobacteria bacterium]